MYQCHNEIKHLNKNMKTFNSLVVGGLTLAASAQAAEISISIDPALDFFNDNSWVLGIAYFIAGAYVALFGTAKFHRISASLISFTLGLVMTTYSYRKNWMDTTGGTVGTLLASVLTGIIAWRYLMRRVSTWNLVKLFGVAAGFFIGALVFAFVDCVSGFEQVWGFWALSCAFAVVGLVSASYIARTFVLTSTSLIGSYLFMRSWTLFIPGHFPTEADIMDGGYVNKDDTFWAFITLFVAGFIFAILYQRRLGKGGLYDEFDI